MTWSNLYIGLPWCEKGGTRAGVSCWGLCALVYAERLGIVLPTYADGFASSAERRDIAAIIGEATAGRTWTLVDPAAAADFDVLVFRVGAVESHVGLSCGRDRMLHITEGQDVALVRLDGRWKHRLAGTYRHVDMMGGARG